MFIDATSSQLTMWKVDLSEGGVSETKPAIEQLTECLDASLVQEWTEQERVAMEQRGDLLKIYHIASEKHREIPLFLLGHRSLM